MAAFGKLQRRDGTHHERQLWAVHVDGEDVSGGMGPPCGTLEPKLSLEGVSDFFRLLARSASRAVPIPTGRRQVCC